MLTDVQVQQLKAKAKPYKISDGRGLSLTVQSSGKFWYYKYRVDGREKRMGFGEYRDVSLKAARARLDEARALLASGVDPMAKRLEKRANRKIRFEGVANEWIDKFFQHRSATYIERLRSRFKRYLYPKLGNLPMRSIGGPELLACLQLIEEHGGTEISHRTRRECARLWNYAIVTRRAEINPGEQCRGALIPHKKLKRPGLTKPIDVGRLLVDIDHYKGQPSTSMALKLLPYVFTRPSELRCATWNEFDFDRREWRIPAERMKMDRYHLVPLSTQVIQLLNTLKRFTGDGPLLFPGLVRGKPISDATLNQALRFLGYCTRTQHCSHGWRTTASTLLNELGYDNDAKEMQLAHKRGGVQGVYDEASKLKIRVPMMQDWADFLDTLRAQALVPKVLASSLMSAKQG